MTDTELQWRFLRARLIGHGMLLSEKLQEGILTQQLIDSRKLLNSLHFRVNMDESVASGELVIDFYLYDKRVGGMGALQIATIASEPVLKFFSSK